MSFLQPECPPEQGAQHSHRRGGRRGHRYGRIDRDAHWLPPFLPGRGRTRRNGAAGARIAAARPGCRSSPRIPGASGSGTAGSDPSCAGAAVNQHRSRYVFHAGFSGYTTHRDPRNTWAERSSGSANDHSGHPVNSRHPVPLPVSELENGGRPARRSSQIFHAKARRISGLSQRPSANSAFKSF